MENKIKITNSGRARKTDNRCNSIFICLLFIILSCSKAETNSSSTIPVIAKLNSCDSIKNGLLKSTSDTVRLNSCLTISSCDSLRFGIIKPNVQDTLRLLSCINISTEDSFRLGLIKIGQLFRGGLLFYILRPGDLGYDVNKLHGLIVATKGDLYLDGRWGNNNDVAKTEYAIGTGLANTNKIIAMQAPFKFAAAIAKAHNEGGYTDWFLPSKEELRMLSLNRVALNLTTIGQVWSSSEDTDYSSNEKAWAINFANGSILPWYKKSYQYSVRAIRAF